MRRGDQRQRIQAGSRLLTSGAEVVCHGAKGGRGCGRWSRWGWGAGSGSCCAPVRELNWRRMGGNRWNGLVVGQGTGRTYYVSHMVLRWAVGFPKTMVVRSALLLFLFYFLNSKRIRVSGFLENYHIRVSVSFRYRYAYPYPCNLDKDCQKRSEIITRLYIILKNLWSDKEHSL